MLNTYLSQVELLLHDPNNQFWTTSELTGYINEARNRVAEDSKCLRQIVAGLALTAQQESYTPQTFLGSVGAYLVDVMGVTIYWGTQRIKLARYSFTKFDTYFRQYSNFYSRPAAFCRLGATTVLLGPNPDQAYTSDWDVAIVPNALATDTDAEQLPVPFQEPVQYYAAYKAKFKEQAIGEAQIFLQGYQSVLRWCARAYSTVTVPQPYDMRL